MVDGVVFLGEGAVRCCLLCGMWSDCDHFCWLDWKRQHSYRWVCGMEQFIHVEVKDQRAKEEDMGGCVISSRIYCSIVGWK